MAAVAILNFVLGHNFGVDQNFCTKFGTVIENHQPKAIHGSIIWCSNMQHMAAILNLIMFLQLHYVCSSYARI